jgi:hypothetical protein
MSEFAGARPVPRWDGKFVRKRFLDILPPLPLLRWSSSAVRPKSQVSIQCRSGADWIIRSKACRVILYPDLRTVCFLDPGGRS